MNGDVRVGPNYLNLSAVFMSVCLSISDMCLIATKDIGKTEAVHISVEIKPLNLVTLFAYVLPTIVKGRPQLTLIPTLWYLEFPFLCGQRGVQKTKPKERMENGHPDQHKQVIKRLFSLTVGAECSTSLPSDRF